MVNEKQIFCIYFQILLLNSRQNSGQSLKALRSVLNRALDCYPTEPQFLCLLVNIEFMSNVFCRMRRFFAKSYQTVRNESNCEHNWNLILYAIHSELKRLDSANGTVRKPSAASRPTRSRGHREATPDSQPYVPSKISLSANLKHLLVMTPTLLNCNNTSKGKAVFYRALQTCSYSKILYLDGIQYFSSQLQELLDIMTEKEIKIRTPLEEIELLMNNLK
ncbi:unnamed protein product [Oppiella nova]|uniref:Uncharacterized protein n=1 Tax=Oppiella nova TaxID=334625 RepID=A0A7R9LN97_9ACAR|nr:unnamed protein product [Oppiella nova]CAG2165335.1 unnamed protein product [Oppiella nova]